MSLAEDKRASYVAKTAATLGLGAALGLAAARHAYGSPHHATSAELFSIARTAEGRASEAYFKLFTGGDYHPWDMRLAARFVAEHTRPDERVQVYGMDPYFLFLARRLSATPYVYAYDLNVSAALAGGTGAQPDFAAKARIVGMQKEHEADMLARFWKTRPARSCSSRTRR